LVIRGKQVPVIVECPQCAYEIEAESPEMYGDKMLEYCQTCLTPLYMRRLEVQGQTSPGDEPPR
jgi:hypothetical protein